MFSSYVYKCLKSTIFVSDWQDCGNLFGHCDWFWCAHLDNDPDGDLGLGQSGTIWGILVSGSSIPEISNPTHPSHPGTGSSIFVRILRIVLIIFCVNSSVEICLVHWGSIQECFLQNLGNFNIIEINMLRHPFVLGTHLSLHFTPNTRWKAWSTGQARWIRVATRRHKWDFIGCLCRHQQVLFCSCHTAFLGTILFMAQYSFWHNAIDTMLLAHCYWHSAFLATLLFLALRTMRIPLPWPFELSLTAPHLHLVTD